MGEDEDVRGVRRRGREVRDVRRGGREVRGVRRGEMQVSSGTGRQEKAEGHAWHSSEEGGHGSCTWWRHGLLSGHTSLRGRARAGT